MSDQSDDMRRQGPGQRPPQQGPGPGRPQRPPQQGPGPVRPDRPQRPPQEGPGPVRPPRPEPPRPPRPEPPRPPRPEPPRPPRPEPPRPPRPEPPRPPRPEPPRPPFPIPIPPGPVQTILIQNAIITDISSDSRERRVFIMYTRQGDFFIGRRQSLILIIGPQSVIQDMRGRRLRFDELRAGMRIDAYVSAVFMLSNPAQANAIRIIVKDFDRNRNVIEDTVLRVDVPNNYLITGRRTDPTSQIRFNVTRNTEIRDRFGNEIPLSAIRYRDRVLVEHEEAMTRSIPPQTNAIRIQMI